VAEGSSLCAFASLRLKPVRSNKNQKDLSSYPAGEADPAYPVIFFLLTLFVSLYLTINYF